MSEPDVASSDATNLQTRIARDGGDYVVNGRKWFITGALHPRCELAIVMGVSDDSPTADPHRRHSLLLVPMDSPGLVVERNVPIMQHRSIDGHCEMLFRNVRVPGSEPARRGGRRLRDGAGAPRDRAACTTACAASASASSRSSCCATARSSARPSAAISPASPTSSDWIAHSRIEIDQARLLVLRAAWLMDRHGNAAARTEVSAIKVVAAQLQTRVVDRAMQVFGAMGLAPDTPLAYLWTWGRALRLLDGPDEVHLGVVARHELVHARERRGMTADYLVPPHPRGDARTPR